MDPTDSHALYALLTSTWARLAYLAVPFALILTVEALAPLYTYEKGHFFRRSIPNFAITAVFLLVTLLLNPISPYAAKLASQAQFGLIYWLALTPLWACLVGIAGLDLFAYFSHVTMHKIPFLWRFHRMHHADNEVDVTTAFREHPGETLWRVSWHIAAVIAFGTPMWVLMTYLTLSAFNAQLEHANIRVPRRLDRLLRIVFVTPNMHKVHHARELPETDMNYSNLLTIWDRLGLTYSTGPQFEELRYGLEGFDDQDKQSVAGMLRTPFMAHWGTRSPERNLPLAETNTA